MSMSTYVKGFKLPDEKWRMMKNVWDSCLLCNVNVPDEVREFFNHESPDDNGVEVELKTKKWNDGDMSSGYEIKVSDIPKDVQIIRFFNSY